MRRRRWPSTAASSRRRPRTASRACPASATRRRAAFRPRRSMRVCTARASKPAISTSSRWSRKAEGATTIGPSRDTRSATCRFGRSTRMQADAIQAAAASDAATAVLVCGTDPPDRWRSLRKDGGDLTPRGPVAGGDQLLLAARAIARTLGVSSANPYQALDRLSIGGEPEFESELGVLDELEERRPAWIWTTRVSARGWARSAAGSQATSPTPSRSTCDVQAARRAHCRELHVPAGARRPRRGAERVVGSGSRSRRVWRRDVRQPAPQHGAAPARRRRARRSRRCRSCRAARSAPRSPRRRRATGSRGSHSARRFQTTTSSARSTTAGSTTCTSPTGRGCSCACRRCWRRARSSAGSRARWASARARWARAVSSAIRPADTPART